MDLFFYSVIIFLFKHVPSLAQEYDYFMDPSNSIQATDPWSEIDATNVWAKLKPPPLQPVKAPRSKNYEFFPLHETLPMSYLEVTLEKASTIAIDDAVFLPRTKIFDPNIKNHSTNKSKWQEVEANKKLKMRIVDKKREERLLKDSTKISQEQKQKPIQLKYVNSRRINGDIDEFRNDKYFRPTKSAGTKYFLPRSPHGGEIKRFQPEITEIPDVDYLVEVDTVKYVDSNLLGDSIEPLKYTKKYQSYQAIKDEVVEYTDLKYQSIPDKKPLQHATPKNELKYQKHKVIRGKVGNPKYVRSNFHSNDNVNRLKQVKQSSKENYHSRKPARDITENYSRSTRHIALQKTYFRPVKSTFSDYVHILPFTTPSPDIKHWLQIEASKTTQVKPVKNLVKENKNAKPVSKRPLTKPISSKIHLANKITDREEVLNKIRKEIKFMEKTTKARPEDNEVEGTNLETTIQPFTSFVNPKKLVNVTYIDPLYFKVEYPKSLDSSNLSVFPTGGYMSITKEDTTNNFGTDITTTKAPGSYASSPQRKIYKPSNLIGLDVEIWRSEKPSKNIKGPKMLNIRDQQARDYSRDLSNVPKLSPKLKAVHPKDDTMIADVLATKIRVLCWVVTHPDNHQKLPPTIKDTWGKKCTKLLFLSTEYDESIPTVKLSVREGRDYLWGKMKAGLLYIYDHHRNDAEWFLRTDDDTYMIMENLRYLLAEYDPQKPLYLGCRFKPFSPQGYMSGGAGMVLSREALDRAVRGLRNTTLCDQGDEGDDDDAKIGACLHRVGVKAMDTRDSELRGRFWPFRPENHVAPTADPGPDWYWRYSYYPVQFGMDCCSHYSVSFHYQTPEDMYKMEFLIYQLRPYGVTYKIANVPAILRDDFNNTV